MAIPAVGVENWIKGGSSGTGTYSTGTVSITSAAVTNTTGTIVTTANYSNDIRDFLAVTIDAVYKTYSALDTASKPTTFQVVRNVGPTSIQYTVVINTSDLAANFPTWA